MLCGSQRLSWSNFQEVIVWLNEPGRRHRTERMEFVNSIQEVIGRDTWDIGPKYAFSQLHVLLRLTSSFRSTDPRDKVFALLGLSSAGRDPENWPEDLVPNYTRLVQDVYAAAAKYCIRQTHSLSVLSQFVQDKTARSTSPHPYFPSWVPRWDLTDATYRISAFSLHWDPDETRNLIEKFNKASRDTRVTMDQDAPWNILRVLGMRVDIVNISFPTVTLDGSKFHAGAPERYEEHLSYLLPQLYDTCEKLLADPLNFHAFGRTFSLVIAAGLNSEHQDIRHEAPGTYESLINRSHASAIGRGPLWDSRTRQYAAESRQRQPPVVARKGSYTKRYLDSLQRLMNRRLFITSSGHLGLGPASMMSGDTVAILFGGNVPYILRPLTNNQWHFVGECYVDGYMDGEAMKGRDSSRDEWFEIV